MCYETIKNVRLVLVFLCLSFIIQGTTTLSLQNFTRIRRQSTTNCGFRCKSGECVDADKECDGLVDCKDESDETTACQRIRCPSYLFRCTYGACINPDLECNGKQDCKDNSDETSSRCKRSPTPSGKCSTKQFECKSGECIDADNVCDGKAECSDNSDEIVDTCASIRCPGYTYRCAYGACVNGNAKCNGIKECFDGSDESHPDCSTTTKKPTEPAGVADKCQLPAYPVHGKWEITSGVTGPKAGDYVSIGTVLSISCNRKYKLEGLPFIYCLNGKWSGNLPTCELLCDPMESTYSMTVVCRHRDNSRANCSEPVSGTKAEFKCAPFYEDTQLRTNPFRICQDGAWDYARPNCVPACGKKSVTATTLIVGGNTAAKGDYPWQVAIYSKNKVLICGGSLINQRVILTAAHCLTDDKGKVQQTKESYTVAVGKYYNAFTDERDTEAQFSSLHDMIIPSEYRGNIQNFLADIAILVTVKTFELSNKVQPVCVDWSGTYENHILNPDAKGIVTGWGFTTKSGEPAQELKEVTVPYVDYGVCESEISPDYLSYLTNDKMCSGYRNKSTGVCRGDSGGGLVFRDPSDNRYYVVGVVSSSPFSDGSCDIQFYALYTKVSKYVDSFIFENERKYRPKL